MLFECLQPFLELSAMLGEDVLLGVPFGLCLGVLGGPFGLELLMLLLPLRACLLMFVLPLRARTIVFGGQRALVSSCAAKAASRSRASASRLLSASLCS